MEMKEINKEHTRNFDETIDSEIGHEMDMRVSMQPKLNKGNFMANERNKEISGRWLISYGNGTYLDH